MTQYPLTDEIRERYPEASGRWEELLKKLDDPHNRGCYTCRFYNPTEDDLFVDVESYDSDIDDDWLPWDTDDAWVNCSLEPHIETPLKVNCQGWKSLKRA
ncbi:MAG: hypothetical protein U9P44_04340 [archaeon]|nr:hypothetical protein [archaeon]